MRLVPFQALGLAALGVSLLASPGAHAQGAAQYNGSWSVNVVTAQGDCDRAYRYAVAIENGRVRYAGTAGFTINGSVAGNGAVQGSISAAGTTVNINGRLSGASGGGAWRATGGRACSGNWSAEKRG